MGLGIKRTRNHKRRNCSSVKKVTLSQYINSQDLSSIEKIDFAEKNGFISSVNRNIYNDRTIIIFTDGSLLAFFKNGDARVVDAWGRDVNKNKVDDCHV